MITEISQNIDALPRKQKSSNCARSGRRHAAPSTVHDPVETCSRCRGIRVHHPVETVFTIAWNTHLASGSGELEVSCLYLAPEGQIAVEASVRPHLLLLVNGRVTATFPNYLSLATSAGMGILLQPGERCQLASTTGAVIVTVEAGHLAADPCGISNPERVMHQQWPNFESN